MVSQRIDSYYDVEEPKVELLSGNDFCRGGYGSRSVSNTCFLAKGL